MGHIWRWVHHSSVRSHLCTVWQDVCLVLTWMKKNVQDGFSNVNYRHVPFQGALTHCLLPCWTAVIQRTLHNYRFAPKCAYIIAMQLICVGEKRSRLAWWRRFVRCGLFGVGSGAVTYGPPACHTAWSIMQGIDFFFVVVECAACIRRFWMTLLTLQKEFSALLTFECVWL